MATCSLRAVSASLLSLSSSRSSPSLTLTCSAHRRLSENKLQQPEQMSNRQLQNQHFDIEAAHQTQTVSPSSGSSRHLSTLQQQQQDGDPFHRRTGAVVTHDSETTKTSTTVVLVPDALGCSVRSGNFTAADLDANSAAARSRGAATNGKPLVATAEPRLLHPYVVDAGADSRRFPSDHSYLFLIATEFYSRYHYTFDSDAMAYFPTFS